MVVVLICKMIRVLSILVNRKAWPPPQGWAYRFEAYTPTLWRKLGYSAGRAPRDAAFARESEAEFERLREFLQLPSA
jgi:hypothetical protein